MGRSLSRRTDITREDLVPDAVAPAVEIAVPHDELLLRTVDHGAAGECRVGYESAAGIVWSVQ